MECKRILVTGGAGFLGSHLCERLLEQGHEVICLDNYFTGSKKNVEHLMDNRRFELIRHDIIHPIYLEVDRIYNLACPASPVHYQYNAVKTIKTSVMGAINVLGLAKRVKARYYRLPPPRSMEIRRFIHRWNRIGVMLIPSESAPAMTRGSGLRKRFFLIITV
jgi:nucleoside-diphosphate-sugar epimerase